jgi:hypothetical protein
VSATLRERLEQGRVPLDEALPLVQGLCAELARAHARGRVHGRLSPETVKIVVGAWEVDFAAARPDDGDERDDVRAVAEILTEALTGETGTAAAMRLPPGVRGPILRSLHAQRERRHGTIEELARALGVPLPEPPRQRRVGWPWIAASALLAGVASGAVRLSAVEIAPRLVAPVIAPAPARLTLRIEGTPALVDMLVTALAERPRLEVVRRGEASLVLRAGRRRWRAAGAAGRRDTRRHRPRRAAYPRELPDRRGRRARRAHRGGDRRRCRAEPGGADHRQRRGLPRLPRRAA